MNRPSVANEVSLSKTNEDVTDARRLNPENLTLKYVKGAHKAEKKAGVIRN